MLLAGAAVAALNSQRWPLPAAVCLVLNRRAACPAPAPCRWGGAVFPIREGVPPRVKRRVCAPDPFQQVPAPPPLPASFCPPPPCPRIFVPSRTPAHLVRAPPLRLRCRSGWCLLWTQCTTGSRWRSGAAAPAAAASASQACSRALHATWTPTEWWKRWSTACGSRWAQPQWGRGRGGGAGGLGAPRNERVGGRAKCWFCFAPLQGYNEFSLLSLSCSDYLSLPAVGIEIKNRLKDENVSLSLPSQARQAQLGA